MQKGVTALTRGGWGEAGYRWGTMLLFGGMAVTAMLDLLVHFISNYAGVNKSIDATAVPEVSADRSSEENDRKAKDSVVVTDLEAGTASSEDAESPHGCAACANEVDHVRSLQLPLALLHVPCT